MPRNARCVVPGLPSHVTQRGTNRQPVFFSAGDRHTYLRLLGAVLEEAQARVLAYCLMTNHVHLVVTPAADDALAILLRRTHGRYAQYLNARRQRSGHLWQNRFFSCPLSAGRLATALRYVERNPVRAGLAARADDYAWSSAPAHLSGRDRTGVLDMAFWRERGEAAGWRAMLGEGEDARETRLLRRCTFAGRPFGEEEFVQKIEKRFGRRWRRWGFEQELATAAVSGQ